MDGFFLLDELDSYICVSDMDTYDVLYINKKLRNQIGDAGDCSGKKCYEILQGLTERCSFCTNGIITKEEFYIWQFYNEYLGKEFIIKDKIIDWEGKPARLEIAIDIYNGITPQLGEDIFNASKVISHQEELLKYQSSYLDKLYATLPCGLIQFTREEPRKILSYNEASWKIMGYSSKEAFGVQAQNDILSVVYEKDRRFFEGIMKKVAETEEREEYEIRVIKQDGSIGYMREILEVVQIPTGISVLQDVFVDVTAEREKEIKLNTLVRNLPIALGILEVLGDSMRVSYISEGWYKITGYTAEEYLKNGERIIEEYVYPEDVEDTRKRMQEAICNKRGTQIECRFIKKNGELIWISMHSILVSEENEKLVFYVVYSNIDQIKKNEIEAKKQQEIYAREAKQSQRKYENELQYIETISKDVLCTAKINITKNRVESYRTNDDSEEKMTGFTTDYDAVVRKITASVIDKQEQKEVEKCFSRKFLVEAFENGKLEMEIDCRRKKETRNFIWIRTQIKLMKEPGTEDIIGFVVERDIDRDRSMLSSSRKLLEHIRIVSNEKYYFVIAMDYETNSYDIIQCNQKNLNEIQIFGKITNLVQKMYEFYDEESYELLEVLANESLLESKFANGIEEWTYEGKANWNSDKKEKQQKNWYEHIIIPVKNDDSSKVIYLFTSTLIDERKEKEEELKKALEQAEKAGRAKQEFLSHISHEIRTPLNGIRGMLDILKEKEEYADNKLLSNALVSTKHLSSLINDILDMAKIESGKISLQEDLIFMDELIESVVAIVQLMAEEKEIQCSYNLIHPLYQAFYADEKRLKQILINILSNAIKYTQKGGLVKFEVLPKRLAGSAIRIEFVIEDNGQGMSEEFMMRAFAPFERGEDKEKEEGTGLGLSISKHLIELMGGSIKLESRVPRGTKVTIVLLAEGSKGEESAKSHFEDMNFEGKRALIVEDNEINSQIIQLYLENMGIQTDIVFDGEEAVTKVKESETLTYDIIFMDVMMPRKDGLAATKEIRKMDRQDAKKIPIVAMTANAFVEDIHRSLESGMNYHLSKPFDKIKVMEILAQEFYGE